MFMSSTFSIVDYNESVARVDPFNGVDTRATIANLVRFVLLALEVLNRWPC